MSEMMTLSPATNMAMPSVRNDGGMLATREAQEVQAAVFMAKKFPRDEEASLRRILRGCQRVGLAQKALYSYPRGGQQVTGPSIRLAEAIAQAWGNMQSGVVELDQRDGESTCMAYCWDVETNTRECKIFTVKHAIETKKGTKVLTDPRDIYELVANQGARRKRACILNMIPGDIVDAAVAECCKTMSGRMAPPLIDRLRELVNFMDTYFQVPLSSIEAYFEYPLKNFSEEDFQRLIGIYNALRDGSAKREDFFQMPALKSTPDADAPAEPATEGQKKTTKKVSVDAL